MDKVRGQQRQLHRLVEVVLRNMGITTAFLPEEEAGGAAGTVDTKTTTTTAIGGGALAAIGMHRLEVLDLSENPALSLQDVGRLVPHFCNLRVLQLSDMPHLLPPALACITHAVDTTPTKDTTSTPPPQPPLLYCPTLTELVLHHIEFPSIAALKRWVVVPRLERLHLDRNQLQHLPAFEDGTTEEQKRIILGQIHRVTSDAAGATTASPSPASAPADSEDATLVFPTVRFLSLSGNEFEAWEPLAESVHRVFPALVELFLTDNRMTDIILASSSLAPPSLQRLFASLETLCLRNNKTIQDTRTLDALRVLTPKLTVLRISYDNLLPSWNETLSRMYTIASMPTITTLNRGLVRANERRDSELFYIQRGRREQQQQQQPTAAKNESEAAVSYAYLAELEAKHHDVILSAYREGGEGEERGAGALLLTVTLHPENLYRRAAAGSSSAASLDGVKKVLPSSMTIGKLKALVQKEFGVALHHQRLRCQASGAIGGEVPTELTNESETLEFYGVTTGAWIGVTDSSLR